MEELLKEGTLDRLVSSLPPEEGVKVQKVLDEQPDVDALVHTINTREASANLDANDPDLFDKAYSLLLTMFISFINEAKRDAAVKSAIGTIIFLLVMIYILANQYNPDMAGDPTKPVYGLFKN